jgi:hypothetical protein
MSAIETTIGMPFDFNLRSSCLIISEAKPLPPGELILSNNPLILESFETL